MHCPWLVTGDLWRKEILNGAGHFVIPTMCHFHLAMLKMHYARKNLSVLSLIVILSEEFVDLVEPS